VKILKHPHGSLNYTKYQCKNTKIPLKKKLLFIFSEAKNVILLYMKIEKNLKYPYLATHPFFILGAKKYFYCYEYCEKSRKPLVNSFKF